MTNERDHVTKRCDYSDLPTDQCAHCTGDRLGTTVDRWLESSPAAPARAAPSALPRAARRSLPLVGGNPLVPIDVHDMVTELTRPHQHREPYVLEYVAGGTRWQQHHSSDVPSLVHQLLGAAPAGSESQAGATPNSRPAARIESLDTVMLIDDEAGEWIDRLGGVIPSDSIDPRTCQPVAGSGTLARLQLLHGLHAGIPRCSRERGRRDDDGAWCCERHHLEHDVRRWWHQARIITGWDSAAYRPFNTCPVCDHRGGLRINLEMRAGFCVECRAIWDSTQIGLLAEHIRTENADTPDQTSA